MSTTKIDYKVSTRIRFPSLLKELYKKSLEEKRSLLLDATEYRSAEGLLNTVYMGQMTTATLMGVLGGHYGKSPGLEELIKAADEDKLDQGLKRAVHTVEFMLANPVSKCPMCGQVVPAEDEDAV